MTPLLKLIGVSGLPVTCTGFNSKMAVDFIAAAEHARILSYDYDQA